MIEKLQIQPVVGCEINPNTKNCQDIRKEYKKKALVCHPDKGGTNADMVKLNNSYDDAMYTNNCDKFSTEQSTKQITEKPTGQPTEEPTEKPTEEPTEKPTEKPTKQITEKPTKQITEKPTGQPTAQTTTQLTAKVTEETNANKQPANYGNGQVTIIESDLNDTPNSLKRIKTTTIELKNNEITASETVP